jgi:hypothetical protein
MDLTPIPAPAGVRARERCIVRGQRLVQVKFVALPQETRRSDARRRGVGLISFLYRVIDRLAAARP